MPQAELKSASKVRHLSRNNLFDLLRIVFAILVLLSHAPELTDGNASREIFHRITHTNLTFGTLAVDGFFLLSGFLIIQSWQNNPELLNFLRKRLLRIVPGYLVAALLSTIVVGLVAPGVPHFFHQLGARFWGTILLLSSPLTPPVLPGRPYPLVNGSLWTITYEFRCYLLVALFGICGLLRRPAYWLVATILLMAATAVPLIHAHLFWSKHYVVLGDPDQIFRLTATYFIGGCFYLFRNRMPFRPWLAAIAVMMLFLSSFTPHFFELGLVVFGGYLMFYSARRLTVPPMLQRLPDVSYGIYLYGWPVEILWIWLHHGSPWITFFASTAICICLGWLSWHFIERPMLTLKRKSSVPLAVA